MKLDGHVTDPRADHVCWVSLQGLHGLVGCKGLDKGLAHRFECSKG